VNVLQLKMEIAGYYKIIDMTLRNSYYQLWKVQSVCSVSP
jgi:hypothetical protein